MKNLNLLVGQLFSITLGETGEVLPNCKFLGIDIESDAGSFILFSNVDTNTLVHFDRNKDTVVEAELVV